ncbi:MAG TPA: phospholipase D-like domain-containing protein [Chloroflexota bacterium]|nr:phospholipase D-like domain-containing protein [Chloroflexota bacterium]
MSHAVDMGLGAGLSSGSLLVEPNDGVTPLIKLIDHAQNRIFVSAYILSQKRIVRALDRAEAQGVDVLVLLDKTPFGITGQPEQMYSQLHAAGIGVQWSPAWFQFAHAKFMVLDDHTLVLSSANFTLAGFAHDRDFVLFDHSPADVREADNIFRADWDRIAPQLTDSNLLVSPSNARSKLDQLIARAKHSLDLYSEEVLDAGIVARLARDARHGVRVRIIATTVSAAATRILAAAHARVKSGTASARSLYVHAKAIVVDNRLAFLGSENISTTSLNDNRELGVVVRDPYVVGRLELTFSSDWRTIP